MQLLSRLVDTLARRLAPASSDAGFAVPMAVALLVVCAGLATVIGVAGMASMSSSRERADRAVGLPAADSAIAKYQYALQSDLVQEAEGFILTGQAMQRLVSPQRGDRVFPNADIARQCGADPLCQELARVRVPPAAQYTMREPASNGQFGYWQQYAVLAPDYGNPDVEPNVVIYLRAWVTDAQGQVTTRPRMIRVEYRPGLFADYQIITDGPISIGAGAKVNGPIHSNGFNDGFIQPPTDRPDLRIWGAASARCEGPYATLSTARGEIDVPGCARRRENTGTYVNFLKVEESFRRIEQQCGRYTWCSPRDRGPYLVELRGGLARISSLSAHQMAGAVPKVSPGDGTLLANVTLPSATALLFDDDVYVAGVVGPQNRLSIAARTGSTTRGSGAADIHLVGDTAANNDARSTLGLIAQGNVVLAIGQGAGGEVETSCNVDFVRAAMIAESGSVTVPPVYTTPMRQASAPRCGPLTVEGSIASHHTPIMFWTWLNDEANAPWAGFSARNYSWDERLRRNPPPYFPMSDSWQVVRWSDANQDCLAAQQIDPRCR